MTIQLVPNSWGTLREDNYCHLSDGRLAPKGQGVCTGGPSGGVPTIEPIRGHTPGENNFGWEFFGDQTIARRILGGKMTVKEVAAAMTQDLPQHATFSISARAYPGIGALHGTRPGTGRLSIQIQGAGFEASRVFYRDRDGKLVVYHSLLEIDEGAERQGWGKDFLRGSMAVYQQLGVDRVTTTADIEVGSYAWAKYGFLPEEMTDEDFGMTLSRVKSRVREYFTPEKQIVAPGDERGAVSRYTVKQGDATKILGLIDRNDPKTLWRIADATLDGFKIGKILLWDNAWTGVLNLHDPEQMQRFHHYVGSK